MNENKQPSGCIATEGLAMIYRNTVSAQSKGKCIKSMEWDDEGEYWVMEFTDGTEMCMNLKR